MDWIETLIVAIVEGLTEFLPVSSTGHMIIAQNLLGVPQGDPFVHAFTFIIQKNIQKKNVKLKVLKATKTKSMIQLTTINLEKIYNIK